MINMEADVAKFGGGIGIVVCAGQCAEGIKFVLFILRQLSDSSYLVNTECRVIPPR